MYKLRKMKNLLRITFIATLALGLFSCEKEESKYPFTVTVVSEDGVPVTNVEVIATAPVADAIPYFKGNTNENGNVSFEYDKEAVLQIQATRGGSTPTFQGCNFVKLEADKNVSVKVVLLPYDPSSAGC